MLYTLKLPYLRVDSIGPSRIQNIQEYAISHVRNKIKIKQRMKLKLEENFTQTSTRIQCHYTPIDWNANSVK